MALVNEWFVIIMASSDAEVHQETLEDRYVLRWQVAHVNPEVENISLMEF